MTLSERLLDGKGADAALNLDIHNHFMPPGIGWGGHYPAYTSDLNAVFALVQREDPDCLIQLTNGHQGFWGATIRQSRVVHSDLCRAMLLALLAAKEPRP